MKSIRIIFLLYLGLSFALNAQTRVIPREKIEAVANPRLSADSASLRFEVRTITAEKMNEDDAPKKFIFRFRNISDRLISIHRISTTCSCVSAYSSKVNLHPHEEAEINVMYDPKGHPGKFERKVFIYTDAGTDPAAVLRLNVDVDSGTDMSSVFPVLMGRIRLRRNILTFTDKSQAVEKIPFINISDKEIVLKCNEMILPLCLEYRCEPQKVGPSEVGEIIITFNPEKGPLKENMQVILDGLGLPPSKTSIKIDIKHN